MAKFPGPIPESLFTGGQHLLLREAIREQFGADRDVHVDSPEDSARIVNLPATLGRAPPRRPPVRRFGPRAELFRGLIEERDILDRPGDLVWISAPFSRE